MRNPPHVAALLAAPLRRDHLKQTNLKGAALSAGDKTAPHHLLAPPGRPVVISGWLGTLSAGVRGRRPVKLFHGAPIYVPICDVLEGWVLVFRYGVGDE